MRFAYTPLATPDGRVRYAPLLEVRIFGSAGAQRLSMLVDSGSEETLLPKPVADLIGVLPAGEEIELLGVGGVVRGRVASGELRFKDQTFRSRLVVSAAPLAVLGHQDFFERFRVTFDGSAREFFVTVPQR